MQTGPIGFQLRFVGHGADQRVPEHVLALGGESHLVDEFGRNQFGHVDVADEIGQEIGVELQTDHRSGVQSSFRRRGKAIDA
jgi:hypothetical protein